MPPVPAPVSGLHHVTAYAPDPQQSIDFYRDVLGLRLVKQTVLFNNPSEVFRGPTMYHFYFADGQGTPGTVMTLKPHHSIQQGQVGRGQATATAFTIPEGAVSHWQERLQAHDVQTYPLTTRFGDTVLRFQAPDGQPLELVTGTSDIAPWTGEGVPEEHGIRGFHSVTLHPNNPQEVAQVLNVLGYEQTATEPTPQDGDWMRFSVPTAEHARFVDVYNEPNMHEGRWGYGTVHHVAFRANDDAHQKQLRTALIEAGYGVTSMKDRNYFHSVYFRTPSGINVEIATDPPGFAHDEPNDELGQHLQLPPFLEPRRDEVTAQLADITL
jgi:glyoxalase family protein